MPDFPLVRILHPVRHVWTGGLVTWADVAQATGRPLRADTRWTELTAGSFGDRFWEAPAPGVLPVGTARILAGLLRTFRPAGAPVRYLVRPGQDGLDERWLTGPAVERAGAAFREHVGTLADAHHDLTARDWPYRRIGWSEWSLGDVTVWTGPGDHCTYLSGPDEVLNAALAHPMLETFGSVDRVAAESGGGTD